MNGTPTYRAATAEEHWAANALISLAFGRPVDQQGVDRSAPEDMRVLVGDGDELLAALHVGRLGQWWLGRQVPRPRCCGWRRRRTTAGGATRRR